jgi:hypothetical protein
MLSLPVGGCTFLGGLMAVGHSFSPDRVSQAAMKATMEGLRHED